MPCWAPCSVLVGPRSHRNLLQRTCHVLLSRLRQRAFRAASWFSSGCKACRHARCMQGTGVFGAMATSSWPSFLVAACRDNIDLCGRMLKSANAKPASSRRGECPPRACTVGPVREGQDPHYGSWLRINPARAGGTRRSPEPPANKNVHMLPTCTTLPAWSTRTELW